MEPDRCKPARPPARWSAVVPLAALPWLPFIAMVRQDHEDRMRGVEDDLAPGANLMLFLMLSFVVLVLSHVLALLGRITIWQFPVLNSAPLLCVGFLGYALFSRSG